MEGRIVLAIACFSALWYDFYYDSSNAAHEEPYG